MQKDEVIEEINNVNAEFYHAFENLSIEKMDKLWKHDEEDVVCIHPGWDVFRGWIAVQESWITIFSNTDRIKFVITNTKIRIYDHNIAVVVCLENIETILENSQVIKIGVNATNIFEKNEQNNKWLLVHHHGSPVSNYIPPNISSQ